MLNQVVSLRKHKIIMKEMMKKQKNCNIKLTLVPKMVVLLDKEEMVMEAI